MKHVAWTLCVVLGVACACAVNAWAAETEGKKPLTVAVLDFGGSDPAHPQLGKDIAEAIGAMLGDAKGIKLVDRQSLAKTLQEQELNMTGLVDSSQAVKVGNLVGAKIVVTGRAFKLGSKIYITAKLVGTETSLTEGVLVKGDASDDLGELAVTLADKLSDKLKKVGPKLVATDKGPVDLVGPFKRALAGRKLPVVAVIIREQHHASPRVRQPIDPAVETEIKKMLIQCGFKVQDVPENELTDFARYQTMKDPDSWPRSLEKVDMLIAGEAFSEFASRIGNIVNCASRAEINVIRRKDGKVVLSDRVTTRASDLSENIAGKKALQDAGQKLGVRLLKHFDKTIPSSDNE
ncbi:MAG: hypothetical protein JW818_07000 [Pirellulales bacterium]|nr:hypothetical protein [Pirellulales bacterium]